MSDFVYQPIFEHSEDSTDYRKLEGGHVSVKQLGSTEILAVEPEALSDRGDCLTDHLGEGHVETDRRKFLQHLLRVAVVNQGLARP